MRLHLWLTTLFALGCAGKVHIQVMEPAEISVSQDVKKLALVDRQSNKHSFRVMYALREGIAVAPRFEVVDNSAAQQAMTRQSPASGQALTKTAAQGICRDTGATGIVSLAHFVIDDSWDFDWQTVPVTETQTVTKTVDGEEVEEEVEVTRDVVIHEATFRVKLDTRWTLYDCEAKVLDSHTMADAGIWTGEGSSRADAKLDTGQAKKLRAQLLGAVGRKYRSRISPFTHQVQRLYFRGGSAQLRQAHADVQSGAWSNAHSQWEAAAKSGSKKVQAKAWHNLALYYEQKGDLETAISYAKKAAGVLGKDWVKRYPKTIEERVVDHARLKEQLGEK